MTDETRPASTPPNIVLASTSPYRREQLERLGIPFKCEAPTYDEESAKAELARLGVTDPPAIVAALARGKAESLRDHHEPGTLLIGGDQVAAIDGEILGKPGSRDAAIEQLARLAGREHQLVTGLCVVRDGTVIPHLDVARLTIRPLGRDALARYVDADRSWDCAGAYKVERRGIALFERIACEDHSAITGLPLVALTRILDQLGVRIP